MNLTDLKQIVETLQGEDAAKVTAEQLDEAREAIRTHVAEAKDQPPSEESIALLTELVAAKAAVDSAQDARDTAAAEQAAKTAELLGELEREPEPKADEATDEAPANDTPENDDNPAPAAENEDTVTEQEPELIAASAAQIAQIVKEFAKFGTFGEQAPKAEAPKGRTGRPASTRPAATARGDVATMRVFAGKDDSAAEITDNLGLAKAFHDAYRGTYQTKGFNGRITVASARTEYPESRTLGRDAEENFRKMDALTSPTALVAAGGLCAPLEVDYSVDTIGSTNRPLRDALVRVTVDRGGITFRPNYSGADAMEGTGKWTMADDEAAGDLEDSGAPRKTVGYVDCPEMQSAEVYAIYNQLEFSNVTTRFDPESTQANVKLSQIVHARYAENELYAGMAAGSKLVVGNTQVVGAARHLLVELDKILAYFRNRHRIDENVNLTWVAPLWLKNEIRADIAYQLAAGDWEAALSVSDAQINQWFGTRGVTPVFWLDGSTVAATVDGQSIPRQTYDNVAAGGTIPAFPAKVDSLLFQTGTKSFLDGGELDLGLVRDSALNARNRYQTFVESWEGVVDRGIESLRPLFTLKPTGATSGTVTVS